MVPLNILHVLRTPVGGLFRHVLDLAGGQSARGHRVGIVCDSATGGPQADAALAELAPSLALGLTRTPMRRAPGPLDMPALLHVMRRISAGRADVVHGHGAKGGAYVRLALNAAGRARVYTPHGGSMHYDPASLSGRLFLGMERLLIGRGDLYIFESAFSADVFREKIGTPAALTRVVHNGVGASEFEPVELAENASDLLFIGELRMLKGVDVLIETISLLHAQGRRLTATLVGAGADRPQFEAQVARCELAQSVRFAGAMPARKAFALGKVLAVPSRAESLPYIVLEAAAAGKPLVTTRVGGIAEIYGPLADSLIAPNDAAALAEAILRALDDPQQTETRTAALRARVGQAFTVDSMIDGVLAAYAEALAARAPKHERYEQFAATQ
jgi:glycosyltransferase involved in cell wall biosynthesis